MFVGELCGALRAQVRGICFFRRLREATAALVGAAGHLQPLRPLSFLRWDLLASLPALVTSSLGSPLLSLRCSRA